MAGCQPSLPDNRIPLSVVVLTYNEERNLPACLESVADWVGEVFVVDSGSTDRTLAIAAQHSAEVVTHAFESHAKQWNWAFHNLPFSYDWLLCLDADHRVMPKLRDEIWGLFGARSQELGARSQKELESVDGFYIKRRQVFRGKWIRHGGYYPKYMLKLVRHHRVWSDEQEFLDFRFYVKGRTALLQHDLIEDNQNEFDITFWIVKHARFARLMAHEELCRRQNGNSWGIRPSLFGSPDQRTLWLKSFWYHMPLYVRPFLYFAYRYFLRFGFLDGKQGFLFHFLQGFWYRLLIDVILDDLRQGHGAKDVAIPRSANGSMPQEPE